MKRFILLLVLGFVFSTADAKEWRGDLEVVKGTISVDGSPFTGHDEVTLGASNIGVELSGQEITLPAATNAADGAATAEHITAIEANTTHSGSDGKDHSDVVDNTAAIVLKAPIASPTFTGLVTVSPDGIQLDTSGTPPASSDVGLMYWNSEDSTVDIVLPGGSVGQIFKEDLVTGKNDTGTTLIDGTVATYLETVGASGTIRIGNTVASASENPIFTLGIVTHDILDGETGDVTTRGKVRGIQTDGLNYSEEWEVKDVLYKSPTVPGGLTKVPPEAPIPAIPLAVVVVVHATNGTLLVRPTYPQSMSLLTDVNGTSLTTSGQFLVWNQVEEYYDPNYNINDYILGTDIDTLAKLNTHLTDATVADGPHTTANVQSDLALGIPTEIDVEITNTDGTGFTIGAATASQAGVMTKAQVDGLNVLQTIVTDTQNPQGFKAPENVTVSYDETTRTVTLGGTVKAYYDGSVVPGLVDTWESAAHPDVVGDYFLQWGASGEEWIDLASTDPDYTYAGIAYVHYGTTNKWALREVHGLMSWEDHQHGHNTTGTYKETGGGTLSDYTVASTTPGDRRPSVSVSVLMDEDLPTTVDAWPVDLYTNFWLTSTGTDNFDTVALDIVPLSGNQPYWNEFSGGVWSQTLLANNNHMIVWVVQIPATSDAESQKYRTILAQGQYAGATLAEMQDRGPVDYDAGDFSNVTPESVFVAKIIIKYTAANWTIVEVDAILGTKLGQVAFPSGHYLSSVGTDATLTGIGTTGDPLSVVFVSATDTTEGVVELATTGEAVEGTDTGRSVTPTGLTARMEAPGEIGGTTPDVGNFTEVKSDSFTSTAIDGDIAQTLPANTSYDASGNASDTVAFFSEAGEAGFSEGTNKYVMPSTAADLIFVPNGSIAATNTQAAIQEVRDEAGSGSVDDTVYGESWDGDTTTAASKNALFDKIETITAGSGGYVSLPSYCDSSCTTGQYAYDTTNHYNYYCEGTDEWNYRDSNGLWVDCTTTTPVFYTLTIPQPTEATDCITCNDGDLDPVINCCGSGGASEVCSSEVLANSALTGFTATEATWQSWGDSISGAAFNDGAIADMTGPLTGSAVFSSGSSFCVGDELLCEDFETNDTCTNLGWTDTNTPSCQATDYKIDSYSAKFDNTGAGNPEISKSFADTDGAFIKFSFRVSAIDAYNYFLLGSIGGTVRMDARTTDTGDLSVRWTTIQVGTYPIIADTWYTVKIVSTYDTGSSDGTLYSWIEVGKDIQLSTNIGDADISGTGLSGPYTTSLNAVTFINDEVGDQIWIDNVTVTENDPDL